mmetsp:Transcript_23477/g.51537  ORF Transcript_23477/g.51537 Transcript_23477/m.51537 type:complete len:257 (-) Transcript_23477:383-1153(-)
MTAVHVHAWGSVCSWVPGTGCGGGRGTSQLDAAASCVPCCFHVICQPPDEGPHCTPDVLLTRLLADEARVVQGCGACGWHLMANRLLIDDGKQLLAHTRREGHVLRLHGGQRVMQPHPAEGGVLVRGHAQGRPHQPLKRRLLGVSCVPLRHPGRNLSKHRADGWACHVLAVFKFKLLTTRIAIDRALELRIQACHDPLERLHCSVDAGGADGQGPGVHDSRQEAVAQHVPPPQPCAQVHSHVVAKPCQLPHPAVAW